ncbi:Uncharacterized protein FKW44_014410, partial [Caligus rogercresseyi]
MGLFFSRDEVLWLIQYHENPPARQTKYRFQEDLIDRFLPELLFLMEECRALVRKYGQVIQRYYVQYLSIYDAVALNKSMQSLTHISEEDSIILSSSAKPFLTSLLGRLRTQTTSSTFGGSDLTGRGYRAKLLPLGVTSDKLHPKHCAALIAQVVNKKKRGKSLKIMFDKELPGSESYRKTREDLTTMDKLHMASTELCYSINYTPTIN